MFRPTCYERFKSSRRLEAQTKPATVSALDIPCPDCHAGETNPCPGSACELESCEGRLALRKLVRAQLRALFGRCCH